MCLAPPRPVAPDGDLSFFFSFVLSGLPQQTVASVDHRETPQQFDKMATADLYRDLLIASQRARRYITIPPILDAILCTWIMHAVSKIQISHFTSSFSCTRARPPRRAARSASGKKRENRTLLPSAIWGPHVGVSRSLAACDWRARLVFLAKHLMEHRCGVSDVPH